MDVKQLLFIIVEIMIKYLNEILTFFKKLLWHFYTRAKMIQYSQAKERHVEKGFNTSFS